MYKRENIMDNQILTARDYTIKEYIKDNRLFIIPRYQRNYAWEKRNIVQLVEDIQSEDSYYIGNIIVNSLEDGIKEVIDGQQRIISIFLLLIAIYHKTKSEDIAELFLDKDRSIKIDIEKRSEVSGISVIKAIVDDNISAPQKRFCEVQRYYDIEKLLKACSDTQIEIFLSHLLDSKIVEVSFSHREQKAHEMFVNLNTKGKPLEEIEILKSHLFKYLSEEKNSDKYKDEWFDMLNVIGDKYYGKYLQSVSLFRSSSYSRKNARDSLNYLLQKVTNKETAEEVFDFVSGNDEIGLYKIYAAVKNHDINSLSSYLSLGSGVSIDSLDELWKIYGQIKFEQFDIVMIALLYCPNQVKNKRKELERNYLYIIKMLKLLLMYQLYNASKNISPSQYTNRFERAAIDLYNVGNIVEVFSELIKDLRIMDITEEEVKVAIEKLQCNGEKNKSIKNTRRLRVAKFIIQIVDENYQTDLKAEHIISESSEDELTTQIGNILPVVKDRYKNKAVEEKLKMYAEDSAVNSSMRIFLQSGISGDNYREIICKRTSNIANSFWKKFEELRNGCQDK